MEAWLRVDVEHVQRSGNVLWKDFDCLVRYSVDGWMDG